MTRRDYILIAETIKSIAGDGALCMDSAADRIALATQFAHAIAEANPNFDTARFISAATFPEDHEEVAKDND